MSCSCGPEAVEKQRAQNEEQLQKSGRPEKGGRYDVSRGIKPLSERKCTDLCCCLFFVVCLLVYVVFAFYGASDGDMEKLINARDFRGDYCGVDNGPGRDYTDFPKQVLALNLTEALDPVIMPVMCAYRDPLGLDATFQQGYCQSTVTTQGALNDFQQRYDSYFAASNDTIGAIVADATKNFYKVCARECDSGSISADRSFSYRPYMWPDVDWAGAVSSNANPLPEGNYSASSSDYCPYDEYYCVFMPRLAFEEQDLLWRKGQCKPAVDTNSIFVGELFATQLSNQLQNRFDMAEGSLSKLRGTVDGTWDTTAVMIVLAFVLGIAMLVLIRFFVGPIVWILIFIVFAFFAGAGIVAYSYAFRCASDGGTLTQTTNVQAVYNADDCNGGSYFFADDWVRQALQYSAYVFWGIAGIWALLIACFCTRVRLAIRVNKTAALYVAANPSILPFAIVVVLLIFSMTFAFLYTLLFTISQVPPDYVGHGYYTYEEAVGTTGSNGVCTENWRGLRTGGTAYLDGYSAECAGDDALCWRCSPARIMIDHRFWVSLLVYFWTTNFLVGLTTLVIATSCCLWFFWLVQEDLSGLRVWRVFVGLKWTLAKHMGTAAFGSLIIAIVKTLKWFMRYLAKMTGSQNRCLKVLFTCLAYCIWCFEKILKFISAQAYVQTAIFGTPFCTSCVNAVSLMTRNAARFAMVYGLGVGVRWLATLAISAATGVIGFLILDAMHPEMDPSVSWFNVVLYVVLGYVTGSVFMSVFGTATDACLQAFLVAEELDDHEVSSKLPPTIRDLLM